MSEKISVTNELIKELRDKTGAGITACKRALEASNCNVDIAIDTLRKKGLASADKKMSRIATEGLIHSYIHAGSRIGILVELNCETDFVARRPEFKNLAKDIAMQLAACPNIQYVSAQHIPEDIVNYEKAIEASKEDLLNKPEEIKEKIVAGRIEKRLKEMSLMDQPFIKDANILIQELVSQQITSLGENIQIRRFQRFVLGEGLKKKNENFADEIAKTINMQ